MAILTHSTSKVPYLQRPIMATRYDLGGFPEEFGRHHFSAMTS